MKTKLFIIMGLILACSPIKNVSDLGEPNYCAEAMDSYNNPPADWPLDLEAWHEFEHCSFNGGDWACDSCYHEITGLWPEN